MVKVCGLCWPNAVEYGELIEDHYLFENEGKYGLMTAHGHGDKYVAVWFPEKPTPDPDPDCTNDDCDWIDKVCEWSDNLKTDIETGYFLIRAMEEAGWKGPPSWSFWLWGRAGRMIEEVEKQGMPTLESLNKEGYLGSDGQ